MGKFGLKVLFKLAVLGVVTSHSIPNYLNLGRRLFSQKLDQSYPTLDKLQSSRSLRNNRDLEKNIFISICRKGRVPDEETGECYCPAPKVTQEDGSCDCVTGYDADDNCIDPGNNGGGDEEPNFESCTEDVVTEDDCFVSVSFYFEISTTGELPSDFQDTVCHRMEEEITSDLYEGVCDGSSSSSSGTTITGVGRNMECNLTGDCMPSDGGEACTKFKGTVVVSYTTEDGDCDGSSGSGAGGGGSTGDGDSSSNGGGGTGDGDSSSTGGGGTGDGDSSSTGGGAGGKSPQDEVEDEVLPTVEETIEDPETEGKLDEDLADDGVDVTEAEYSDGSGEVVTGFQGDNFEDEGGGLNRAGKIAVAFMAFLVFLLLLLCCWWRREVARRKARAAGAGGDNKSMDGTYDSAYLDEDSYMTSDFNNLGLHHSKLDVHECTSATCRACMARRSQSSPELVQFVSTKGRMPLPSGAIALEGIQEEEPAEDEAPVDTSIEALSLTDAEEELPPAPAAADEGAAAARSSKFGWFGRGKNSSQLPQDEIIVDDAEEELPPAPAAADEGDATARSSKFGWFRRGKKSSKLPQDEIIVDESYNDGGDSAIEVAEI